LKVKSATELFWFVCYKRGIALSDPANSRSNVLVEKSVQLAIFFARQLGFSEVCFRGPDNACAKMYTKIEKLAINLGGGQRPFVLDGKETDQIELFAPIRG
tara:strand:- start:687 stop:989 length:303 start_codon:yes stop_codon:yes gene_type:complete